MGEWISVDTELPEHGVHVQLFRPVIQFVGYYGGVNCGWIINAPGLPTMWPKPTFWKRLTPPPAFLWQCKNCGENERPRCPKCTREDGLLVTDELVED